MTTSKCFGAGVMANLVGAEGFNGDVVYEGYDELLSEPGVNIHIYGKAQTRPFRKMGHVKGPFCVATHEFFSFLIALIRSAKKLLFSGYFKLSTS